MKFPQHKAEMAITHNEHRCNYETVADMLKNRGDYYADDCFKDAECRQRCIDTDEIWVLHWYPETPVGFCHVVAPTFEEVVAFALEVEAAWSRK